MMKYKEEFYLLDGREDISLNQEDCDYFLYETDDTFNFKNKEDRGVIKNTIREKYEEFKASSIKQETYELKQGTYKFSFSRDYTELDTQEKLRKKTFWSGWNSIAYEKFINDSTEHYFFVIGDIKENTDKAIRLHIIHFERAKLDKLLQKKELAANGVYYFYFSQERDLDIDEILTNDFSSLEGTWKNGKNEKLIIKGATITNKNHKLFIPSKNDNVDFPFLYVKPFFGGGYAMGLLKAGDKLPKFPDVSNYMRPRLVLGQTLVQYKEYDYFYRS